MNKLKLMTNALALFALLLVLAGAAHALPRTYVTMSGNDASSCAFATPCRTFKGALMKTDSKGEIIPLENGNYGLLTIDKPVSIIAPPGVHAEISLGGKRNRHHRLASGCRFRLGHTA